MPVNGCNKCDDGENVQFNIVFYIFLSIKNNC